MSHLCRRCTTRAFCVVVPCGQDGVGWDPVFTYANRAALELWETTWDELVGMPSRKSAAAEDDIQKVGGWGAGAWPHSLLTRGWVPTCCAAAEPIHDSRPTHPPGRLHGGLPPWQEQQQGAVHGRTPHTSYLLPAPPGTLPLCWGGPAPPRPPPPPPPAPPGSLRSASVPACNPLAAPWPPPPNLATALPPPPPHTHTQWAMRVDICNHIW